MNRRLLSSAAGAAALAAALFVVPARAEEEVPAKPPSDTATVDTADAASVTDALQGQEGVRIQTMCTHCNSANIQVGGLSADLVPIQRDGYPLLGGLATSFVLNSLPADTVAEARVVRGPALAGEPAAAAGGMISLIGAKSTELPWFDASLFAGSFSRLGGSLRASGPVLSWLSGTLTYGLEKVDAVDDDGDGNNDIASVDRTLWDGRIVIQPSRRHAIDLGGSYIDESNELGRGGFDYYDYFLSNFSSVTWTREDATFDRSEFRGGYAGHFDGGISMTVRGLTATRDQKVISQETDVFPGQELSQLYPRLTIREDQRWGRATVRKTFLTAWIEAGVEYANEKVRAYSVISASNPTIDPATDATDEYTTTSAFADFSKQFNERFSLDVGVRYDEHEIAGNVPEAQQSVLPPNIEKQESVVSPRVEATYRPTPAWMVRALIGATSRPPKPIFAEVCCGQSYQRNYNGEIESALTYGVETVYQPAPDLRASAYLAQTDFDDHLLRFAVYSQLWRQTYAHANVAKARAQTAELVVRWSPAAAVTIDGSIGWLSLENRGNPEVEIDFFPPNNPLVLESRIYRIQRIPYRPSRTGSLGVNVRLPRGMRVAAQTNYTGSMEIQYWRTEPDFTLPDPNNLLVTDDTRSTPGFWMTSLSFEARLSKYFDLTAGVDNLGDYIQSDLRDFTRDYNWGPLAGRSYRVGLRAHLDR